MLGALALPMPMSLEDAVLRVVAGEPGAWQALWRALEPKLDALLRRPRVAGRMSGDVDHRRTIITEVMARLSADDFARLRRFVQARAERPDLGFLAWIAVVAKRVTVDHMRGLEEYVDRRHVADASSPGAWREQVALPSEGRLGHTRTGVTDRISGRQLLALAGHILSPEQLEALEGWLRGEGFAELAAAGALATPKDAERLVRSALQKLRRHAGKEPTP